MHSHSVTEIRDDQWTDSEYNKGNTESLCCVTAVGEYDQGRIPCGYVCLNQFKILPSTISSAGCLWIPTQPLSSLTRPRHRSSIYSRQIQSVIVIFLGMCLPAWKDENAGIRSEIESPSLPQGRWCRLREAFEKDRTLDWWWRNCCRWSWYMDKTVADRQDWCSSSTNDKFDPISRCDMNENAPIHLHSGDLPGELWMSELT
jgi:hypothetical protein